MTWGELIRRLRAAGFVERRTRKGGHRQLAHPETKKTITVSAHTSQEVGTGLAHRMIEGGGVVIEHYPVVVERESNGTFSAWVAGLPGVYAAADTAAAAKRGIRSALAAHLDALTALGQDVKPQADLPVQRHDPRARRAANAFASSDRER